MPSPSLISDENFLLFNKIASTVISIIAFISCVGNVLIVAVTIKSKKLHSACHVLIGIQAFSDIIMQSSHFPWVYFSYSEVFVSIRTCFFVTLPSTFTMDFSTMMMFFIALDRFIASKHAMYYSTMNRKIYFSIVISTAICTSCIMRVLFYTSIVPADTVCFILAGSVGNMVYIWFFSLAIVNLAVVVIYLVIRKQIASMSSEYDKINKSIQTIILVYIFGWLLTTVISAATLLLTSDFMLIRTVTLFDGIGANFHLAAQFFIYYFRSNVYNEEFKKMLGMKSAKVITSTTPGFTNIQSSTEVK